MIRRGTSVMSFDGSVLIFLDGPTEKLEFCMNGVFGRTASKFEGFYSIPLDEVHVISYRLGGEGPFISLICRMTISRVLVFEWSRDEELFKLKSESSVYDTIGDKLLEYPGLIQYKRFMDQQPGAQESWTQFTQYITESSLTCVFQQLKVSDGVFEVTPMIESHHSLLKNMSGDSSNAALNFKRIPSVKEFSRDPEVITKCAMDRSVIFESMKISFADLLSELQISFLLLTFTQNFEGFEQWLDIVNLHFQSYDLAKRIPNDFERLLAVVEVQLEMCPDDFFGGLMNENKLYKLFNGLFSNTEGKYAKYYQFYTRKFGWTFEDELEDEEYAPVICSE